MEFFQKLKKIKNKLEDTFLQLLSLVSLTITYLVGIGPTHLIGLIVGKKFLPPAQKKSQWQVVKYSNKVNRHLY